MYSLTGLYFFGTFVNLYVPFSHSYMDHIPVSTASLAISRVSFSSNSQPLGQGASMCIKVGPAWLSAFLTLFIRSRGWATVVVATYFTAGCPPITSCGASLGKRTFPSGIILPGGVKVGAAPSGVI